MLAAVFFATIILPLVCDGFRFRQVQTALDATDHVFRGFRRGGSGRGRVSQHAAQRIDRQPNGNTENNKPRQIHGRAARARRQESKRPPLIEITLVPLRKFRQGHGSNQPIH